jgi:site-specific recombinase XerD
MKKATYKIIFNRRNRLNKAGQADIEIRVTLNRQSRFFSTGVKVAPDDWNKRGSRVKDKHPHSIQLNQVITDLLYKMERYELKFINQGKPFHLSKFDEMDNSQETELFTDFWERLATTDHNLSQQTRRNHLTHLNHLKAFQKKIAFSDLTPEFLARYESHLIAYTYTRKGVEHHLKPYALHSIFRSLKAYVNKAVKHGKIPVQENPFIRFDLSRYERHRPDRKFLKPDQIRMIEDVEFGSEEAELEKCRDAFLLACYTGLSSTDVISLSTDQIIYEEGKGYSIERKRDKNQNWFYIPIYRIFGGKAERIIERYQEPGRKYLFDEFTNQKFNNRLKIIARRAGIQENVTFHMGRHSCAKYLLDLGLRIEVISKILGHTKTATTQIYASVDKHTIDQEIDKLKF